MKPRTQVLHVWGDLACFTRPEMKVERFSYPVITPSAARAIFEAIYWKPKFRWQVTRIEVLRQPRYIALRRNEMKGAGCAPDDSIVEKWVAGEATPEPIWADGESETEGRTQRQTMALKNVEYVLSAEIRPWPDYEQELPATEAQFRRRAERGQCIYQPYLGCREFPGYFALVDGTAVVESREKDEVNLDVGIMLYDVFDLSKPGDCYLRHAISLFHAQVNGGVLEVPDYLSDKVLRTGAEVM